MFSNMMVAPASDQIRGPCPGLNAAANHAYFAHSGVALIEEAAGGLNKCEVVSSY